MFGLDKTPRRRYTARENRVCTRSFWQEWRAQGAVASLGVAAVFWLSLSGLFMLRQEVVAYRPGQNAPHDILARVDFDSYDKEQHLRQVNNAREFAPHIFRQVPQDGWAQLQDELLALPGAVAGHKLDQLEPPLKDILDGGALAQLELDRTGKDKQRYEETVHQFVNDARRQLSSDDKPLVILKPNDFDRERINPNLVRKQIVLRSTTPDVDSAHPAPIVAPDKTVDFATGVYSSDLPSSVLAKLQDSARGFDLALAPKIARYTATFLAAHPTYTFDENATTNEQNEAAAHVEPSRGFAHYARNTPLVQHNTVITDDEWQLLRAENDAYYRSFSTAEIWQNRLGLAGMALVITLILGGYVARYQPRCIRNHARGIAMASLLLSMLLLTQLAGIGSSSLFIFGIAPTIVAAIILTIAYDQRFALGMATIHTLIVTISLDQNVEFFLIVWVGVLTACYLLDDIRTRSKLIEVGGAAALAMIAVTAAVGAVEMEPIGFIAYNCLYTGAAGLAAGFVVLGILPFIEKAFRITTSMTLLELADASQPLLRRLALEAPGTYNHSLQVATLAEEAAEAIDANSLLCRVASYYHDIGKINKPDYFVENQMGGENRHLNLSPSLSLRIILSHVKDGVEMAKEYNLPTSILPIIQQHHGTTLVEYFYHQACNKTDNEPDAGPRLSDTEFRYPGPKPKSRESAIVMLCDAVESACRAMSEPTSSRIESLVHDLSMKRLHDGQFDECDMTMRDLEAIERSLGKTLLGIYHGRIAYPSTSNISQPTAGALTDNGLNQQAARSA